MGYRVIITEEDQGHYTMCMEGHWEDLLSHVITHTYQHQCRRQS